MPTNPTNAPSTYIVADGTCYWLSSADRIPVLMHCPVNVDGSIDFGSNGEVELGCTSMDVRTMPERALTSLMFLTRMP